MPAAEPPTPAANDARSRRGPLTLSQKIFSLVLLSALVALFWFAFRRSSAELFSRLSSFSLPLVALGFLLNALAFAPRAWRLNLLLPEGEAVPFARAWSLSGAATFFLQVLPFRSGELATWAAIRSVLGATWARSGAVFALSKLLDTATLLLTGVAGAAVLLATRGTAALGGAAAAACVAGALVLFVLPAASGRLVGRLASRLPEGTRRRALAEELESGLAVARRAPARYALAALAAFAFLGLHLLALSFTARGLGIPIPPAALAVALLASILTAGVLPSPAGTFGPYESGFAAAAAVAAGLPLATGAVLGALLHLLTTLAAGAVGIPFLLGRLRENRRVDERRSEDGRI